MRIVIAHPDGTIWDSLGKQVPSRNIKHAYDGGKIKFIPREVTNAKRDSFGRFCGS